MKRALVAWRWNWMAGHFCEPLCECRARLKAVISFELFSINYRPEIICGSLISFWKWGSNIWTFLYNLWTRDIHLRAGIKVALDCTWLSPSNPFLFMMQCVSSANGGQGSRMHILDILPVAVPSGRYSHTISIFVHCIYIAQNHNTITWAYLRWWHIIIKKIWTVSELS